MVRRLVRVLTPFALGVALVAGASPAGAAAVPSYLETATDDPVTAAPPVTTPTTRHCTVTLAEHVDSNDSTGAPQGYSGTLTPPADCQGPWAKVVLSSTVSVSGRQYDRSGTLTIGGATVWFGTTQEPSGPTPTTFSFTKDITDFSALLETPQPYSGGIVNYTSDVYTGVYDQTVTVTYYEADATHPAPDVPDAVVGVPVPDLHPGSATATVPLPELPRNITRARLSTTLKGNGCDEQWFTAVPDEVAADFPGDGLCAHSAYREALVSVDGTRAGAVGTFPHIYSGGVVPTLWRPVLAIDTLDLRAEDLDLTPFAGTLVDGGSHALTFGMDPIGDTWNVVANLFLWTDHHRARTSGSLTRSSVAAAPTTRTTSGDPGTDGAVDYRETARRSDVVSGWLDTSRGRVTTTVTTGRTWSNSGTVSDHGLVQSVHQQDRMTAGSVSTVGHRVVRRSQLDEQYPIDVDFSAADYTNDQNFRLNGAVTMTQRVHSLVDDGAGRPTVRGWTWTVDSTGVLARSDGVTSESDGSSRTAYHGTTDDGARWSCRITTDHGRVLTRTC